VAGYKESAAEFEAKWQKRWAERNVFRSPNPGDPDFDPGKPKYVVLDMFPYPSGVGLHIGHPLGYIATDIFARFLRMRGMNVLHAMGFDAFGLPAEQYAIQTGQHPAITTEENTRNMLRQLRLLGLGHDEGRRFSTTDPDYYRWTQWIFLQLFHSFYDPEARWTDPAGREVLGRARPIAELERLLATGAWVEDESGEPAPASRASGGRRVPAERIAEVAERGRLATVAEVPVNWCPMLGTVLSNEEVTNEGRSERGDYPVYRRPLKQWMLKITAYADRLLKDLDLIDWPRGVVEMQKGWIGRSEGAEIDFAVPLAGGGEATITVYTTRPDTLFGATFVALAPARGGILDLIVAPDRRDAVEAFVEAQETVAAAKDKSEAKTKTGVFTGAHAINPATGERVPIWVVDYVIAGYGKGAIMAVPAHDERDFDFAKAHGLPLRAVVAPDQRWLEAHAPAGATGDLAARYAAAPGDFDEAFVGDGVAINSSGPDFSLEGQSTPDAKRTAIDSLARLGRGRGRVQYKLRDWLFSRQRYWGEPFPVVTDLVTGRVHAVAESELPVLLPEMTDFRPVANEDPDSLPVPPLARAEHWMTTTGVILADGTVRLMPDRAEGSFTQVDGSEHQVRAFRRDPNTMPNWAGSCWYYLRYFDARNEEAFVSAGAESYWGRGRRADGGEKGGAVDLYVGGTEHAVLHLLYARFWHKVLYDLGHVSTPEPFDKLFNQGMITADAYKDSRGVYVDVHDVEMRDEGGQKVPYEKTTGERLTVDPGKMGKRYKNGIPPEEVAAEYTTDTFRCYEMYLGPLDASKPWQADAIIGIFRFLNGVWRLATGEDGRGRAAAPDEALERVGHKTIRAVTEEVADLRMNTALGHLIKFYNALTERQEVWPGHVRQLVLMLAPFAPHLGEELMERLDPAGHAAAGSVLRMDWPTYDPEKCKDAEVEVPIQVNGKKRDAVTVPVDIDQKALEALALDREAVRRHVEGKTVARVIVVRKDAPSLVNIVVK
jgi:leucyl-tRNA synthetase